MASGPGRYRGREQSERDEGRLPGVKVAYESALAQAHLLRDVLVEIFAAVK